MLRLYRIVFFLNVIIMLFGALFKMTHVAIGVLNGNSLMFFGKLFSALVLFIAYFLMLKSTQMKVVEKALWMLLFGVVFIFLEGLIVLLPGLLFYIIGIKRFVFSK